VTAAVADRALYSDFCRLAGGLRAMRKDFDYAKTRKLLDPAWDGYSIPDGHDVLEDDVELSAANLVTSQHRGNTDLHRVVLDLDYGAVVQPGFRGGSRCLDPRCRPALKIV
jgi:hypothetical protein